MPTTSIQEIHLKFQITFNGQPLDFSCQVIDATLTLPGAEAGTITEVACPGGVVSEPGSTTNGTITGNIFVDPAATGVTWALATMYQAQTEFPYEVTYYADLTNTSAIVFSGNAKVGSFTLPFGPKPNKAKQPLDLSLITAVMARPAAVA